MNNFLKFIWCILLTFVGCTVSILTHEEQSAADIMKRADSLVAVSAIPEAIGHYYIITEQYSATRSYPEAVFKLGVLFCSRKNPWPNDSVALGWFHLYKTLPISRADSAYVDTYISLLERMNHANALLARHSTIVDSLSSLLTKNSNELLTHDKRIAELEAQIKQTNEELTKLREVDVHISKRGTKK
jgi:hypothetical protein